MVLMGNFIQGNDWVELSLRTSLMSERIDAGSSSMSWFFLWERSMVVTSRHL